MVREGSHGHDHSNAPGKTLILRRRIRQGGVVHEHQGATKIFSNHIEAMETWRHSSIVTLGFRGEGARKKSMRRKNRRTPINTPFSSASSVILGGGQNDRRRPGQGGDGRGDTSVA
jgi:hypothetical protein